jgi:hypothetical protein
VRLIDLRGNGIFAYLGEFAVACNNETHTRTTLISNDTSLCESVHYVLWFTLPLSYWLHSVQMRRS